MFAKMSKISKLFGFRKDKPIESDTESVSSYETVPEEMSPDKTRKKQIEKDVEITNDKSSDEASFDSSSGLSNIIGSENCVDSIVESEPIVKGIDHVVEHITVDRVCFIPSAQELSHVSYGAYTGPLIDPKDGGQGDKKSRTERSSGSDDTLQYLESDPQLEFLQSELLQRLQLVRMDSAKSDPDENEDRPNFERSRSDLLERIIEEETKEIVELNQSEKLSSDIVEGQNHLAYPKVESVKVCDAVTERTNLKYRPLTLSSDSEGSIVINTGLSDDEEYHRVMAMSDFTPSDSGGLSSLVPGSDIESGDSLPYMAETFYDEVKVNTQHSKRKVHT